MEIVYCVQSRCASEAWGSGSRPNVAHDGLVGFFPFQFQLHNFISASRHIEASQRDSFTEKPECSVLHKIAKSATPETRH
jgi:hypothetical protein